MKKWLPCILMFAFLKVFSQNEFAATAFYNDFKKIHADAQEGFLKYKGSKKKSGNIGVEEEYRIKLLLPLADSGRIVFPSTGKPYAEFFFQTANTKKQIDERAVNLRQALFTVMKNLCQQEQRPRDQNKMFFQILIILPAQTIASQFLNQAFTRIIVGFI